MMVPAGRGRLMALVDPESGQLAGDRGDRHALDGEPVEDLTHPARLGLADAQAFLWLGTAARGLGPVRVQVERLESVGVVARGAVVQDAALLAAMDAAAEVADGGAVVV